MVGEEGGQSNPEKKVPGVIPEIKDLAEGRVLKMDVRQQESDNNNHNNKWELEG